MIAQIQSKQDVIRALNDRTMSFSGALEVVNQGGVKAVLDRLNALVRAQKKVHVLLVERK